LFPVGSYKSDNNGFYSLAGTFFRVLARQDGAYIGANQELLQRSVSCFAFKRIIKKRIIYIFFLIALTLLDKTDQLVRREQKLLPQSLQEAI
jgi:hypothetical protein